MSFGLVNAPSKIQCLMDGALGGIDLSYPYMHTYLYIWCVQRHYAGCMWSDQAVHLTFIASGAFCAVPQLHGLRAQYWTQEPATLVRKGSL